MPNIGIPTKNETKTTKRVELCPWSRSLGSARRSGSWTAVAAERANRATQRRRERARCSSPQKRRGRQGGGRGRREAGEGRRQGRRGGRQGRDEREGLEAGNEFKLSNEPVSNQLYPVKALCFHIHKKFEIRATMKAG